MSPEIYPSSQKQQGSAIVVALFVIVVMGLLVASMSRFLQTSSETISYEVLGTRAFFAAQTGLEQGLVQLFPVGATGNYCKVADTGYTGSAADTNSLASADLAGCSFSLSCSSGRQTLDATAVVYYRLTSVGSCTAGSISSQRTVSIEVWQ
ncbi:type II secretory pathway component [Rheinheimera marina]|uniref:Type II secretory pathway component n=1 Tax=Rheinheimera marina TaxID=1774958 RepID=A0ABV9JHH6_9GAMM